MSPNPDSVHEMAASFRALAARFDLLAKLSPDDVPTNAADIGSGFVPVNLSDPKRLIRQKKALDNRKEYEAAILEAGELFIQAVVGAAITSQRALAFIAARDLREAGGILESPSNLFALFVGGPCVDLGLPDGTRGTYETTDDGIPPSFRAARVGLLMDQMLGALAPQLSPIPSEQCARFAEGCRTLGDEAAELLPLKAEACDRSGLTSIETELQKPANTTDSDRIVHSTAPICEDAKRLPDEKGNVQSPSDESAYVPAKEVLERYSKHVKNHHDLNRILTEHPEIKRWVPRAQRLSVHLADFDRYMTTSHGASER